MMNKKGIIITAIIFILLIALVATAYFVFKEGPEVTKGTETVEITNELGDTEIVTIGAKNLVLTVVDNNGVSNSYELNTDVLYLNEAMEEAGIDYEADGSYVNSINGVTADYNKDKSYWAFYVNDEYCNYGIFEQPVKDGDNFKIEYTIYEG